MNRITASCRITNRGVFVDGQLLKQFSGDDPVENLGAAYKGLALDYPKFYKMDLLAKAAFLGVEILKSNCPDLAGDADDDPAMLFANSESSSDTDLKFEESYGNNGLPSPSLFVYTLPNIAMGEVAIRNKWYGSQMFAVFPNFAPAYYADQARLLSDEGAKKWICGWIDVREKLDVLLFALDDAMLHEPELVTGIQHLYDN